MNKFTDEIKNSNMHTLLNTCLSADPNINYDIFEKCLLHAKNKHMPKKNSQIF